MTNLHTADIGHNKYCGPAVLSILTGKSTDECASVISHINGKYTVEGVKLADLLKAADKLGFDSQEIAPFGSLFSQVSYLVHSNGLYIVTLPKHFVVIEINDKKAFFCDNHTKEPIPAASSARLSQKVISCHRVTKRPEPVLISTEIRVFQIDNYVNIERQHKHQNPKDDYSVSIGALRLVSGVDLVFIANKLVEIYNENQHRI
jgi:ABC-type bacteriocin/lantibiotic exporter with double-glycine peptidase domain